MGNRPSRETVPPRRPRPGRDDPPATLANMRSHGVTTMLVYCTAQGCWHQETVDVSHLPDDTVTALIGRRLRCSKCGKLGADALPNWPQRFER